MISLLSNDATGKRLMLALAEGHGQSGFTEFDANFLIAEINKAEIFLEMCRMSAQGDLKIIIKDGDVAFKTTETGLEKLSTLEAHS